jgi:hypothetical protein
MSRQMKCALSLALLVTSGAALAEPKPVALSTLPAARLAALAPMLRSTDLALLESTAQGAMRQITTLVLVAAPPHLVREVFAHPERYDQFVRNLDRSQVKQLPDGSLEHSYRISNPFQSIYGTHRYLFSKEGPVPPVEILDAEDPAGRHLRWEFLPAGGGTLLVVYGYTPIPNTGLVGKLITRVPTLEYGLALMSQMGLVKVMKERAEQLAGGGVTLPTAAPGSPAADYQFLVERGAVAFLRTAGGRLSDISMISKLRANPDETLDVLAQPAQWSEFVPSISRSLSVGPQQGAEAIELEQSVPLMSWRTVFAVRRTADAVDMLAMSGDLRGSRLRWDVRRDRSGGTQVVLRSNQAFERTSMVLRQLYKIEPSFQYGVNVGLTLPLVWGVKARAERMLAQR